jgi:hypothetical protein
VWERVGGVSQVRNGVQVVLSCGGERWEWVYIGGAPKLAVFDFSAQKPVEPVPKPVFKKLRTAFWLTQQTGRKKWTVQKPVGPVLKPVELVSTRQKLVECPAEPVFFKKVNSAKTGWTCFKIGWTCIFQKAILAKIDLKRLYYILSLTINKGKMEVLDQGFWALVPTPTFFMDPPW